MGANMLSGSGPVISSGGNADGPSPGIAGSVGAAPQAAPNQPEAPNALARGGMSPGGLPMPGAGPNSVVAPSLEKLQEAYHKQAYTVAALERLLETPDLKTKDVLNEVGDAVADGIMGPFDAAQQLKTMPPGEDSLAIRKWVGQHYANAVQAMQTVSEMLAAHGAMSRQMVMQRGPTVPMQPPPEPGLQNALMG